MAVYLASGCNGDGGVAFSFLLSLLFWPRENKAETVRARESSNNMCLPLLPLPA
jgi:hypothetical protein